MDSSAPLSFPSEPDDIGDLFSSYIYESPELNTQDDFKHHRESENEVVKEENADVEEASGTVKCVQNNYLKNEGIGSSCLLSPFSEPPDIKSLFSSYVYESPALDSVIDFRASVYNDNSITEQSDSVDTAIEREHFSDVVAPPRNELGLTPAVPVGSVKSAEDDKSDGWIECDHESVGITDSVSNLKKQQTNCENISADHSESQNETSDGKLPNSFSLDGSQISSETNSGHGGSKFTKKLICLTEKFRAKDSLEDTNKVLSTRRLDFRNQMNNKHSVKLLPTGDNEKENYENEFAENGFVSTRKHKETPSQRSFCPTNSFIVSAADSRSSQGDATGRRKVLSEATNIQLSTVSGTTGKWKCPQRSKPNLGPPLKQLRLEKWVHRS